MRAARAEIRHAHTHLFAVARGNFRDDIQTARDGFTPRQIASQYLCDGLWIKLKNRRYEWLIFFVQLAHNHRTLAHVVQQLAKLQLEKASFFFDDNNRFESPCELFDKVGLERK